MPKMKHEIETIKKQINSVFSVTNIHDLALRTKFIQRSSNRIRAFDFVYLMSVDLVSNPFASLAELSRRLFELNPKASLTPQALSERINSKACAAYFKEIFLAVLGYNRDKIISSVNPSLLAPFPRVFLEDSTQIELNPKLSKTFAGSGGNASSASVKLNLIEDLKNKKIALVELHEGKKPDQSLAERILSLLKPNDLVLRDLGYFCLAIFFKIVDKQAFFLSRLLPHTNVYLKNEETEEPLDLSGFLRQKKYEDFSIIEFHAFLGSQRKLPVRAIAYRLPDSVVNERRRKARAVAKKKGYVPSQQHLDLLAFAIYITNVDASVWRAEVIGTLYRLRWQIELTFKRWKSLLKIDFCKGTNPRRVSTFIYARLIAVVLLHDFYMRAACYADSVLQRELSPHQFYQWLIQKQRLAQAIQFQQIPALWKNFTLIVLSLCKQKRKRMTTLEMIENEINFLDSFKNKCLISND